MLLSAFLLFTIYISLLLFGGVLVYADDKCISYDKADNTIEIGCGKANLTDIYNSIGSADILNQESPKVWLLNASLNIKNTSTFYINSTDTDWLKINSIDGDDSPNHILAKGNLKIDSVKLTGWDIQRNDNAVSDGTSPRSYILVNYGNGTTNITNSEIAFLGYDHPRSFGLTYYTGNGSIINKNRIHDLWYGFYSDGSVKSAHNLTIENNEFYNTVKAIDPHSGAHDILIRNNTVYNNTKGIICSTDCYHITIDSNTVFSNDVYGIRLHKNVTNSTIRNNLVYDNKEEQISLYDFSNYNNVLNNVMNGGKYGVKVTQNSSYNNIYENKITNSSQFGVFLLKGAAMNIFSSNTINHSHEYSIFVQDIDTKENIFRNNYFLNSGQSAIKTFKVGTSTNHFDNNTSYIEPVMKYPYLRANLVFTGFAAPSDVSDLSPVTTFEFLGPDDIIILEKNTGKVRRILDGDLLKEPLLDVNVANEWDRGLLGIAVTKDDSKSNLTRVFLYFTRTNSTDGSDQCPNQFSCVMLGNSDTSRNVIYRYDLVGNNLVNPKILLNLPASPGPRHNAGYMSIGPDNNLYVTVGDIEGAQSKITKTKTLNYRNGTDPDGRAGILRITQDGEEVKGIIGNTFPLDRYFAYGIRNSFGIDFDPVTGYLWDTENGDHYGDEINLVEPGFNSGWKEIQGAWEISNSDLFNYNPSPKYKGFIEEANNITEDALDLEDFDGKGKYSDPKFIWNETVSPTAIKFLDSDKYGSELVNDIIVGDYKFGNLYDFKLDKNRTQLVLKDVLKDKIANNQSELESILLGEHFGKITDLKISPDGFLYVLSFNEDRATIYKITRDFA
jgi:aldose sugar dehydrogenase